MTPKLCVGGIKDCHKTYSSWNCYAQAAMLDPGRGCFVPGSLHDR